jgi:Family of unknown function (DUF6807)
MLSRTLFALVLIAATAPAADSDRRVDFRIGSDLVTTYHVQPDAPKPYLWPLNAPGGLALTRAWPIEKVVAGTSDHPHHVSGWFCHGDVDGVDFWSIGGGHGAIVCTDPGQPKNNRVRTRNEWRLTSGKRVLDEVRTIAVSELAGGRLIVMTTDLVPAAGPVVFGDTKEGAFAVRVSDQLRVGDKKAHNPKSRITNADGKEGERACWGYQSDWCDYSGDVDGKPVGVAIFDDPANKPRACWHVRDYGLLAANPFGRAKSGFPAMRGREDLVRLGTGQHLKLRYAIFLHSGDAGTGRVKEAFARFVMAED